MANVHRQNYKFTNKEHTIKRDKLRCCRCMRTSFDYPPHFAQSGVGEGGAKWAQPTGRTRRATTIGGIGLGWTISNTRHSGAKKMSLCAQTQVTCFARWCRREAAAFGQAPRERTNSSASSLPPNKNNNTNRDPDCAKSSWRPFSQH